MKNSLQKTFCTGIITFLLSTLACHATNRQLAETLDRGLVAINLGGNKAFVSWRYLKSDPIKVGFNLYKSVNNGPAVKLNPTPIIKTTSFQDINLQSGFNTSYYVCALIEDVEQAPCKAFTVSQVAQPYISIPVAQAPGDAAYAYAPNDAMVADLDGDGEYEIIIKRMNCGLDGPMGYDNSQGGISDGGTLLEAYKLDGTFMWRVNLGINIRQGAHYTHPIVFDFDGDGKAEVTVRTSEGTVFGDGVTIGDVNGDGKTDYVNRTGTGNTLGQVISGPEFLSVIEGSTGREKVRTDFIARGDVKNDWLLYRTGKGDTYGGRSERTLAGLGYFDGEKPSILICRGYYGRTVLEAWDFRDNQLTKRWRFDTQANSRLYQIYEGRGNHSLAVADVDNDGKDEVVYGGITIDDNGSPLHNTGLRHGDAMHLTDLNPDRPGLEVWSCHEEVENTDFNAYRSCFRDANTGQLLWGVSASTDVGRAMAADIDARFRGCEVWTTSSGGVKSCTGASVSSSRPSVNMAVWWDGDLNRELLDGITISKWTGNGTTNLLSATGCAQNNSTKANPCIHTDIFGDWREEVIWRSSDNRELRIYTSTTPTNYRFHCLMQDDVYRNSTATQNVGYNQPSQIGVYFGSDLGKYTGQKEVEVAGQSYSIVPDLSCYDGFLSDDGNITPSITVNSNQIGQNNRTKIYLPLCYRGQVFTDSVYITLHTPNAINFVAGFDIKIWPTSFENELYLQTAQAGIYKLKFYSLDGCLQYQISQSVLAHEIVKINTELLGKNVYILVVETDSLNKTYKVLKR